MNRMKITFGIMSNKYQIEAYKIHCEKIRELNEKERNT